MQQFGYITNEIGHFWGYSQGFIAQPNMAICLILKKAIECGFIDQQNGVRGR